MNARCCEPQEAQPTSGKWKNEWKNETYDVVPPEARANGFRAAFAEEKETSLETSTRAQEHRW